METNLNLSSRHPMQLLRSVLLCLLIPAAGAFAQEGRRISLEEAVQLSLKNSKSLQLSQAKIEQAVAMVQQAKDKRLPDVSVSGSALWLPSPNIQLDKDLQNPGTGSGRPAPAVNSAFYGTLSAREPLFTGFKIQAGIESAQCLANAAQLDKEHHKDAIIENTITAYTALYKADAAIQVVKENLAESIQRVKEYSSLEKNGVIARNDLLKAQLEASNLELGLLEAEKDRKLANTNLNILLGLPVDGSFYTTQLSDSLQAGRPLEEWQRIALENRKDLFALSQRESAAKAGVKAAKGDYYPSLAVTGGYFAANVPGLVKISNAINLGLAVQYPISSLWKTRSVIAQAEARQQEVKVSQAILQDGIILQLNKDYEEALLSKKKIVVLEKSVTQAEENYRIINNKFKNSLATTTEVLDANVARLRANLLLEFSKADAQVSHFKLEETAGVLSARFSEKN